jgi:hypothetical protein
LIAHVFDGQLTEALSPPLDLIAWLSNPGRDAGGYRRMIINEAGQMSPDRQTSRIADTKFLSPWGSNPAAACRSAEKSGENHVLATTRSGIEYFSG